MTGYLRKAPLLAERRGFLVHDQGLRRIACGEACPCERNMQARLLKHQLIRLAERNGTLVQLRGAAWIVVARALGRVEQ